MSARSELEAMVGTHENIIWKGRPDKKCFILESIFNPMMPFALIWAIVDFGILGATFLTGAAGEMALFLIPFFALHLMPVWIYLGGLLFTMRKFRNTEYIITDKAIYVSGGVFTYNCESKPFTDLSHVNIHRGIFDQWLKVGDVVSQCSHGGLNSNNGHGAHTGHGLTICDIPDYQYVYNLIKEMQTDIYADTMYPNDLRPGTNHGYQTEYIPRDRQ